MHTRTPQVYPLWQADEGNAFGDFATDLAQRLEESSHPSEKLALLRSFFFWIQVSA